MVILHLIDFNSVANEIDGAKSKQELLDLVEVVDERYLNNDLLMKDSEWPLFNAALQSKLDKLAGKGR